MVTEVSGNLLRVRREGASEDEGPYRRLESYASPAVGHLVLVVVPGGGSKRPVVIGREVG